jgi:hypothetical protein
MKAILAVFALCASGAWAQSTGAIAFGFPAQLAQYLGLSESQVTGITGLKSQLASFQAAKLSRIATLQVEIVQESSKPAPDAMSLGARYLEMLNLQREIQSQQKLTVDQAQALLTADQKAKLATLQSALTLYPTACAAVDQNLIAFPNTLTGVLGTSPFPTSVIPASRLTGVSSYAPLILGTPVSPCITTVPTAVIRNGDFSGTVSPSLP